MLIDAHQLADHDNAALQYSDDVVPHARGLALVDIDQIPGAEPAALRGNPERNSDPRSPPGQSICPLICGRDVDLVVLPKERHVP